MLAREALRPRVRTGGVLEEQECVADGAGFARGDDLGLDPQAFGVGDAAELKKVEVHGAARARDH